MKTLFLATAAVAAFAAAPAFAQDQGVGSVGVTYNNTTFDIGSADAEAESAKLDVAVAIPVAGEWAVTLDGGFNYDFNAVTGEDRSNVNGTVHGSRAFGNFRAAAFAGGSQVGDDALWSVGAQGQMYLDKITLSGSVAYETGDHADVDAWSVGADAAYFVTPAFRVNGGLGWSNIDLGVADTDAWSANVGGEYQIANTPFSVTANYAYADIQDADLTVDTFTIGFRYSFGGDLQARERTGADLGRTAAGIGSIAGIF